MQALHLGEVHLHGGAGYEAALGDDPAVGENELGGAAAHEGHDDEGEADDSGHGGDERPAAAVEVDGGARADDAEGAEQNETANIQWETAARCTTRSPGASTDST